MSITKDYLSRSPQKNIYRAQRGPADTTEGSFLAPDSAGLPPPLRSSGSGGSVLTPTSVYNTAKGDYFGEAWQNRTLNTKFGETAMSIQYVTTGTTKPRRINDVAEDRTSPRPPQKSPSRSEFSPNILAEMPAANNSAEPKRTRGHRSPTQKTMLSRALAKANTAVLLDNSQKLDGAIEAYAEACDLLQQVMMRSSDMDDRKKLSAIRKTYSNRIAELHDLDDTFANLVDKDLPNDPPSDLANNQFFNPKEPTTVEALEQVQIPPRTESLIPQLFGGDSHQAQAPQDITSPPKPRLDLPMESRYMPAPLSPRRMPSTEDVQNNATPEPTQVQISDTKTRRRGSTESTSWLDIIEDGESLPSSYKSRLSRHSAMGLDLSNNSLANEIEAEFDAALNAAVDAAYDSDDLVTEETPKVAQKPHLFDTRPSAKSSQSTTVLPGRARADSDLEIRDLDEDTTDEEERLLDEMTEGYVFDDYPYDARSKTALPRQSDSSTFSGRTQSSSNQSTLLTAGTNLSTLAEDIEQARPVKDTPLPPTPMAASASPPKQNFLSSRPERLSLTTLRDRRLSGQTGNALKIETYAPARGTAQEKGPPKLDIPPVDTQKPLPAPGPPSTGTVPITPLTSIHSTESMASESPATPALTQGGSRNSIDEGSTVPLSPSKLGKMMPPPTAIRKKASAASLRQRNVSISASTDDQSPMTPASAVGPSSALFGEKRLHLPPLPTPTTATFTHQTSFSGGMHLFDDHVGVATSPKTPRSVSGGPQFEPPVPLESCPEAFLLRPWWLMRCLYQVVAHPRGGHLTTKLFLPRDIWRVKNVKLRLLEDKISQCDILTAALLALAKVDNFDAEAMLEAMQFFENELDKVRVVLQKKLGTDVGVTHSNSVFRSPTEEDHLASKSTNSTAKSFASGWRKLRSKSSSTAVPVSTGTFCKDVGGTAFSLSSLPMTTSTSVQTSSRSLNKHKLPPPTPGSLTNIPTMHATYMASLARLFDAVQILDSIARQVEDPGLKASNETHVGLELSVRNAAEFFSFYIIRFVMADVTVLVDKFLKRGAEWVLA